MNPPPRTSCRQLFIAIIMLLLAGLQRTAAFRASRIQSTRKFFSPSIRLLCSSSSDKLELAASIQKQAEHIRTLKATVPVDKDTIATAVQSLLQLKANYEQLTGQPFDPKSASKKSNRAPQAAAVSSLGNQTTLEEVVTPRLVDYSAWYNDVLAVSDMVDQSPVRGCMVIKPWGMGVWDLMRTELDARIRDTETQNAYFPLFIPKSFLAKEAEHVDGFAKECAVVTHHRLCMSPDGKDLIPDPEAKLEEPLVVRPTSETVIWNMFSKWIHSYRDLPLKINQWANVVRWEMRTRPFLRTSEFLWQEGHTAHATADEAVRFSKEILDMYAAFSQDFIAMPVIKGEKSPSERFAGADSTFTIEAMMQNGWALQSGTSHFLGQNFAKAFEVFFQTDKETRELVWATSWGVSTRLIGAMIMTHSDDIGLVLPPKLAPVQVVIVPITTGKIEKDDKVLTQAKIIQQSLKAQGIRCKLDDRVGMRPGVKYFEWERKGVPLRIEVGPRDVEQQQISLAVRHNGTKQIIPISSGTSLSQTIQTLLHDVHSEMFNKAQARLDSKLFRLQSYAEMKTMLADKATTGFYLVPWACNRDNEAFIKEDCKATIRCYPQEFNNAAIGKEVKCFYSGQPATHYAIFARAF